MGCRHGSGAVSAKTLLLCAAGLALAAPPFVGALDLEIAHERSFAADRADGGAALPRVTDGGLRRYVAGVGKALARASEQPDLDWRFEIIDEATPSASASPDGRVYVTRGLLTLLGSEAELAAVLAHAIAHVVANHAPQGSSFAIVDEREADALGLRLLIDQGYDAAAMQDALAALARSAEHAGRIPAWAVSHAYGAESAAALAARLAELAPEERQGDAKTEAYLRRVDGLAYGDDPRYGYFDGDMFYHPELAFELLVPATWRRLNTPAALHATSPAGDTVLELTLAPALDATQAAAAFLAQPGITELGTSPAHVNGRPALVSRFTGAAEAAHTEGIAVHIEHAGKVFRVLVYATAAPFAEHEPLAERIVESFAPVTDERVLGIERPRLRIVDLARDMSLTEFAREYPSVVPLEELALINRVEGPAARLRSGAEVKQVT